MAQGIPQQLSLASNKSGDPRHVQILAGPEEYFKALLWNAQVFFKWDPVNCSDRQQLAENRESSITANELHSTSLNSRAMGGTKDTATSTL